AAGDAPLFNGVLSGGYGINITTATANVIGGTAAGAGNVVSSISILSSSGTVVQGNLIGTDVTGTTSLGGTKRVFISDAQNNQIGGTAAGAGNLIVGGGGDGVHISGVTSHGNRIQHNAITGNAALGIDLEPNGSTPN